MKIKSITIVDSKGKSQTMTLKSAKELYESLDEIFGAKTVYDPLRYIFDPSRPYVDPWSPITYGDRTITTSSGFNMLSETAGES